MSNPNIYSTKPKKNQSGQLVNLYRPTNDAIFVDVAARSFYLCRFALSKSADFGAFPTFLMSSTLGILASKELRTLLILQLLSSVVKRERG